MGTNASLLPSKASVLGIKMEENLIDGQEFGVEFWHKHWA